MIYTLTVNPSLDYTLTLGELAVGEINRATSERITVGGKGVNVSVMLSRLGCPTVAWGFVGGFTGEELLSRLASDGIATDFVRLPDGETRVNVKLSHTGGETAVNAVGPRIGEEAVEALLTRLDALQKGDVIVLSGNLPKTTPDTLYERIFERANACGAAVAVDAEGEMLLRSLRHRPFVVKPNHHELLAALGETDDSTENLWRGATRLQEAGARNVLVSCGERGALLLDENGGRHAVGTVDGEVVSTVGCGDSMLAGYLYALHEGADAKTALRMGAAAGNATALTVGLADRDAVYAIFSRL